MTYRLNPYSRPTNELFLSETVSGRILYRDDSLIVEFSILPYSVKYLLKNLGGRSKDSNSWTFPPLIAYFNQLQRVFNLEVDESASIFLTSPEIERSETRSTLFDEIGLFDFQKDAVDYLVSSKLPGSLLSLSPGLGKSLVSITAARCLGASKVLCIAPLTLLGTWQGEVSKWSSFSSEINRGGSLNPEVNWTITNYDTIRGHLEDFLIPWDIIIIDESILVKNRDTKRTQAIFSVAQQARKKIWLLSGSPISREVDDLWSQFRIIFPRAFTSYWRFAEAYCHIEITPWGRAVVGSKDLDFRSEFADLMFVRHQREVLDLPEIRDDLILLDLLEDQQKIYQQAVDEFLITLETTEELSIPSKLAQMTRLMQIVSHPANLYPDASLNSVDSSKHRAILELTETRYYEFPAIIWVHWRQGAYLLADQLAKKGYRVETMLGDSTNRDELRQRFQSNDIDILILSTSVGKYGLTLTNARTMIYLDRTFDMDAFIQSQHRVQRIGLDHSPVSIVLSCPKTIDSLIEMNLAGKAFSISRVSNADLASLIRHIGIQKKG